MRGGGGRSAEDAADRGHPEDADRSGGAGLSDADRSDDSEASDEGRPMDASRLKRLHELLDAALRRPPEERAEFLAGECSGDPELASEVETLLETLPRAAEYFDEFAGRIAESSAAELSASRERRRIGRYRTIRRLGRGGMGTVYLAERADGQFRHEVALKLVRRGFRSDEAERRFLAERQLLAELHHPNIARLLDGGVTEDGLPYFVMERVEGEPLVEYCDRRRLGADERLRLFLQLGEAVQHLHRNLVVHRDLKPANVLVTGSGDVELLDFGIAKLLDLSTEPGGPGPERATATEGPGREGGADGAGGAAAAESGGATAAESGGATAAESGGPDAAGFGDGGFEGRGTGDGARGAGPARGPALPPAPATASGLRLMTPQYAAPEQIRGDAVTTATDVFGLGVTLYELLTGRRPFHREGGVEEIQAAVLEDDPRLPSAVVLEEAPRPSGLDPAAAAAARGTTPSGLSRRLRGDLDAICLTALRKEPEQRYRSAEQFVEDIRRHRTAYPVTARGDAAGYRLGKFLRRNRFPVGAVAVLLLVVLAFAAYATAQSSRLARQRDRAERVSELLVDLFTAADPTEARGDALSVREVLDRGAARVGREPVDEPALRAVLSSVLGRVYRNLGDYDRASDQLETSLALHRQLHDDEHPEVAAAVRELGTLRRLEGDHPAADSLLRSALGSYAASGDAGRASEARALSELGLVRLEVGEVEAADTLFRQALALLGGEEAGDPLASEVLENLGAVRLRRGDLDGAERRFRRALEIRRRTLPERDPAVAATLGNLAAVLAQKGDLDEATEAQREALRLYREILGPDHPRVATMLNNLGMMQFSRGDPTTAEARVRESLEIRRSRLPPDHPELAQSLANLGLVLQRAGRLDEAEAVYEEALEIRRRAFGDEHRLVAQALHNLGLLHEARGGLPRAEALLREAMGTLRRTVGPRHPMVATSLNDLASLLHREGRWEEAETAYREALEIRREALPPIHPHIAYALVGLGRLLTERGRAAEAEPLLREALGIRRATLPEGDPGIEEVEEALERGRAAPGASTNGVSPDGSSA